MKNFTEKKEKLVEQIILEKYNQYYRLASSYVHSEADAGDIVQNMAYRAIRSSNKLKHAEYADTWIYRILLNEIYRFLQQAQTISYDALLETEGNEREGSEDIYEITDLQKALDSLSIKDKYVLELRYFEDRKIEEIAGILDENISTVKSRIYRSLKKLRIIMEE